MIRRSRISRHYARYLARALSQPGQGEVEGGKMLALIGFRFWHVAAFHCPATIGSLSEQSGHRHREFRAARHATGRLLYLFIESQMVTIQPNRGCCCGHCCRYGGPPRPINLAGQAYSRETATLP
jgi:hypothetical protein